MTQPVLDMTLAPKAPADDNLSLIERLVRDPSVDVDKLERFMQLHERAQARIAEERFHAAMSAAQREMRPVAADADNPQTRSRYASYAALDRALRPIYTSHGFGLSFNTLESAAADVVRVVCDVSHVDGHQKQYRIDMPADGKGARGGDVMTKTHATGAAMSYGMRYLLKMIWNVAVGEDDDDGNRASAKAHDTPKPSGYDEWAMDMESVADDGLPALEKAWKSSRADLRAYCTREGRLAVWKKKASAVK